MPITTKLLDHEEMKKLSDEGAHHLVELVEQLRSVLSLGALVWHNIKFESCPAKDNAPHIIEMKRLATKARGELRLIRLTNDVSQTKESKTMERAAQDLFEIINKTIGDTEKRLMAYVKKEMGLAEDDESTPTQWADSIDHP